MSLSSLDSRVCTFRHPGLLLEGATMANKDKGCSKSSKTAACKSLKAARTSFPQVDKLKDRLSAVLRSSRGRDLNP